MVKNYFMLTCDNVNNIGGKSSQTKHLLDEMGKLGEKINLIQIPKYLDYILVLVPLYFLNKFHKGLGHVYALYVRMFIILILGIGRVLFSRGEIVLISQDAYAFQYLNKFCLLFKRRTKSLVIIHSLGSLTNEAVKDKRLLDKDWTTSRSLNIEIKGYNLASKIVLVSNAAKKELLTHLKSTHYRIEEKKLLVIHNGIPDQEQEVFSNSFYYDFCSVANLKPIKGHEILVKAVSIIKDTVPNIRLAIVGSGKQESHLKKLAEELEVKDNISFIGSLENYEVKNILRKSKYFVLASHQENFSISLLEAAFNGIPIVATDVGGNSEIISDEIDSKLVKPNSAKDLAEGMLWIMNFNSREKLSNRLVEKSRKLWTSNKMALNYLEIIKKI
ncbi:glycosyltransferase family 4 protein [Rossellomorea vietnamensis]|uniref:Glycosyl transferase family 1 domain-containing protein n=1 Tax=Rossellomorea vietnamensis TaxID=218284 RepID=A0A0P6WE04_9BACI|nr:glycosyltransferase family 4 protein [Rossellomorea vietnamensis]KPL59279.1 hypothetical protein AM506_12210 [Rossellomorea vietnamensis]